MVTIPNGFVESQERSSWFDDDEDVEFISYYQGDFKSGMSAFPLLESYVKMVWDHTNPQFESVTSTIKWGIIPIEDLKSKNAFDQILETGESDNILTATNGLDYYVYHIGGDEHTNTGWYSLDWESAEFNLEEAEAEKEWNKINPNKLMPLGWRPSN